LRGQKTIFCGFGNSQSNIARRRYRMNTPAHLKVLSAGAVKYVVTGLAPRFTQETGHAVGFTFGTIAGVRKRLADGETADVIIGTAPAAAEFEQSGAIEAGSRVELGRTLTGIGVREGMPMPDISTPERFRQAMLDARSIAYTSPQAGGTSGIYLTALFERLDITAAMQPKALLCINGDEVVDKVAAGEAEIGSTFISEIVPRAGMTVVGPLPPEIGNATAYAAGVAAGSPNRTAARQFIALLAAPGQRNFWISRGFEPAG
jgi:molybdate transport system substrate-binding protein